MSANSPPLVFESAGLFRVREYDALALVRTPVFYLMHIYPGLAPLPCLPHTAMWEPTFSPVLPISSPSTKSKSKKEEVSLSDSRFCDPAIPHQIRPRKEHASFLPFHAHAHTLLPAGARHDVFVFLLIDQQEKDLKGRTLDLPCNLPQEEKRNSPHHAHHTPLSTKLVPNCRGIAS